MELRDTSTLKQHFILFSFNSKLDVLIYAVQMA